MYNSNKMNMNMGMSFNRRISLAANTSGGGQTKDTGTDYDHEVDNMRVSDDT